MRRALLVVAALVLLPVALAAGLLLCWLDGRMQAVRIPDLPRPEA